MRSLKALLFGSFFLFSIVASAAWGHYKSGIDMSVGGYHDIENTTIATDFQHRYFGAFTTGGTLSINYVQGWTFKNGSSNACTPHFNYRVYRTSDTPGAFNTIDIDFNCNHPCQDTGNPGDQMWQTVDASLPLNLLSGLTLPGTYVIEIYIQFEGNTGSPGGCGEYLYDSNSGNNYRAYFDLNMTDAFTDGQITSGPTWSGDTGNYQVVNKSTTSGLTGTEETRTHTLKGNGPNASGSEYLSTPITTWDAQQEWYFWIGRDGGQAATLSNQIQFWLYSKDANLEGTGSNNDGYKIIYGDNTLDDNIILQSVTDGTATTIITSSGAVLNGLVDYGIAIRVTRSQLGVWNLYTSYLPQNSTETQSSPTPLSAVADLATVFQGTATNTLYTPSGTGYMGPVFIHSSGSGEPQTPEFDNLRFVALPPNTEVKITGLTTGSVNEDAANTSNLAIDIQLTNPSTTTATTVDLVLTSGAAARAGRGTTINSNFAGPYTTITLTWAANTSGVKTVYIDPSDNTLCDDIATLVFTLQNPTGGNAAYVGSPASYTATITDDNTGYETLLSEGFESGSIPAAWTTTGTAWTASTAAAITGTYSARHSNQAAAGQSSISYPFDDASLPGVNTTWRFQIKYQNDPSSNNNFQVFLAATEANLYSATVDGYAVVIDQTALPVVGTNDYIRLYRVDNGAYASTPIINSTTDWESNVNSGTKVGIEVTLSDAGVWAINIDITGDFDNLVTLPGASSGTSYMDTHPTNAGGLTYPVLKAFGVRQKYTAGVSDFIRFDDVTVSQKGCKETWYSQASGNVNGTIWGPLPVSTAQTVTGGRYKRFVVQGSASGDNIADNVTTNIDWIINDISIDAGATLTGAAATTKVYGNWVNSGTFTSGTSDVQFKGQAAQLILGASSTSFNNLTIDNDGFNITLLTATSVKGRVNPNEGTLQTGGILTLVSNSAGSGSIGTIQTGSGVSGNVTLQRYIPSIPYVYGDWVNLGCPIQGQTIQEWNDDIITTGFIGSDYPAPYPFNNIRTYVETTAGGLNDGYVNATNVTNSLSNSNGYFVWMQGAAQNIDNTGAIQQGTFAHPLSYTVTGGGILNDGWNLMTNPYPSEVDWNLVTATFSVSNPRVYYVYDYQTKAYKNYNATNGFGLASRYVPHSQSFLVKVNTAAQSLTYQEGYKTNVGTIFERSNEEDNQFVAIKLERNGLSDESILAFNNEALAGYEMFDAYDLESPSADAVELSLMSEDNIPLATDSRPLMEDLSIPVYLDMPEAGTYVLSITEVQNLPLGTCLIIEDLLTGTSMTMQAGEQMTLITNAPYQGNRLLIHASAPVSVISTDASCHGTANGSIDVTTPTGTWNVSLQNEAGDSEYVSSGSAMFDHLEAGTYTLSVSAGDACTASSQTIVIGEPVPSVIAIADVRTPLCNMETNGAIEFNVENASWFSYELRAGENLVSSGTVENQVTIVEGLEAGDYTLNVYTTCSNLTEEIVVSDPNAITITMDKVPATVIISEGLAQASFTAYASQGEIKWFCTNGQTATGEVFNPQFTTEGQYYITATAEMNGCTQATAVTLTVKSKEASLTAEEMISFTQSRDAAQITFGEMFDQDKVMVEMFDATGRLAYQQTVLSPASQRIVVSFDGIAEGAYTIRISGGGENFYTRKVVR